MDKGFAPHTIEHFREWSRELILDTGEPWVIEPFQEAFLSDYFSGVTQAWLVIPEGNGKTTMTAGLALYHCEFRQDAWVTVAASSRDQGRILYRQAKGFVRRTPRLEKAFRTMDGYRRIVCHASGGQIEIFAADDRTGDGVIPTLALLDELHRHKSLDLYETWAGKLMKRNAQLVAISTAGEPGTEFERTREKIRAASTDIERDGCFLRASSPLLCLHEWAVPPDGDVEDVELVKQANPFSGITVDGLRQKRETPTMSLGHWRRFVCNLPTRSEFAAISEAEWHNAATNAEIPAGEPVWIGLDVAWKWDTTAIVPLWWESDEKRILGPANVLIPPRNNDSMSPQKVEAALVALHERNPIEMCVMDTHDATELANWIRDELGAEVLEFQQRNTMLCAAYASFMEALREGWLVHSGDVPLREHALNAIARILPGGQTKFDRPAKQSKGTDQDRRVIDALIAAAMVHHVRASNVGTVSAVPLVAYG